MLSSACIVLSICDGLLTACADCTRVIGVVFRKEYLSAYLHSLFSWTEKNTQRFNAVFSAACSLLPVMASGPYTDGTLDERSPPSFFLDWVYTFALSASVAVSSNIEGFKIVNTHVIFIG